MNKFYMLIGLPGSGKSTIAKNMVKKDKNIEIFSSDKLRAELWGSEEIQGDNTVLFNELHSRIKKCIKDGRDCIYDATNISANRRKAFLDEIKKYKVKKICIFALTSLDKCKQNNNKRDRKVPEYVIENMYKTFDIPQYREGWDNIIIKKYFDKKVDFEKDMNDMCYISHDNPHHNLTIGIHMCECARYIATNYATKIDANRLKILVEAAFFHDIGKVFCKQFKDMNGNETDIAHYYRHENVSAYLYLLKYCGSKELSGKELFSTLYVADLIYLHMRMFNLNTDKSKNKLINKIGSTEYQDLCILHEADILMA